MFRSGRRLVALLAVTVVTSVSGSAFAQIYGGLGYSTGRQSTYGGVYTPGVTAPGVYSGSAYGYGSGYGNYGSYSTAGAYGGSYGSYNGNFYGIGSPNSGQNYGYSSYGVITAPVSPMYGTSTTIIRGGPTGGVMQYSNNGNGYTYLPDSTYPTLIQNQPTLGLSRVIVAPSPPPVVVESRPSGSGIGSGSGPTLLPPAVAPSSGGTIKVSLPRAATGSLTYALNGHLYTIQPGYSQTFREDRPWTIEFKRGGDGSEIARYTLKTGNYVFAIGGAGWELQQPDIVSNSVPPSPSPPAPLPELSGQTSGPPTPLPPP